MRTAQHGSKAAGASAFLVATGYHTAMECIESSFAYLGQNMRNILETGKCAETDAPKDFKYDAGHCFHDGASTAIMSLLFNDYTVPEKIVMKLNMDI